MVVMNKTTLFIVVGLSIATAVTSRPSQAAESRPPNILFAIADDWGCHASCYGTPYVNTPNIDRVARDGLRFNHAFTPNAKCAPSRACILTGRNSWQLKEAANHICYFPPEFRSFGEVLTEHGWFVGHTTKGWGPGVAKDADGKPRQMTGTPFNAKKLKPPTKDISNSDYAANFKDFLDSAPNEKPWFFWYGAIEPHRGYEFGSGTKLGKKDPSQIDHVPGYWPDNETVRQDMLDYAFEVEHFDSHLGRMLQTLAERNLLDNTLVIVTSDHGVPFPRCKGSAYYDSNHVPMVAMWGKGIQQPGRVIEDYVSFIDLAPTFIDVAGLAWGQTGMAPSPGKSLVNIFNSQRDGQVDPERDHVLVGMERHDIGRPNDVGYPIRGIIQNDQLYLENFEPSRWPACDPITGYLNVDASPTKSLILDSHRADASDRYWSLCFGKRPAAEFYDLKVDRDAIRNLMDSDTPDPRAKVLKERLYEQLRQQEDPRIVGDGSVFDRYLHANPQHVNYYERYLKGEAPKAGWVNATDYEQ